MVELLSLLIIFPENKQLFLAINGSNLLELVVKMHKKNTEIVDKVNLLLQTLSAS